MAKKSTKAIHTAKEKWHTVQFYDSEEIAIKRRCESIAEELLGGNALICFVSSCNRNSFQQQLQTFGFDISKLQQSQQLQFYDAAQMCVDFTKDQLSGLNGLKNYIGAIIEQASRQFPSVQIYGEIVNLFCLTGNFASALALERIWNELGDSYKITLHCTYILANFAHEKDSAVFDQLCDMHSHVLPSESYRGLHKYEEQQRFIAKLQQQSLALQTELKLKHEVETFLRKQEIELKKARDDLEKAYEADHFRRLAETMPQLVWTARNDAIIEYSNQRWMEYTGVVSQRGDSWISPVDPEDKPRVMDAWEAAVKAKSIFAIEHRIIDHADNQSRWHLTRAVPVFSRHGNIVRWFGTGTDIQDQKKLQEKLAQARDEAQNANAAKTQFLASMSHDLRTPLNAVIGFSELMLLKFTGEDMAWGHAEKMNLQQIAAAGRHLLNLVEGLLNLSAIESGKIALNKETIDIREMLADLSKTYELLARKKGLEWFSDIRTSQRILADRHRLWEVLNNLVNNAIKFTHGNGLITLGAHDNTDEVIIYVKDTGVGIEQSDLERIFIPFEQGKTPGVYSPGRGVGLGLSICRKMVELHGGRLIGQSTKGEGSCFKLILPLAS